MDVPLYATGDAAMLAGTYAGALQVWIARGVIKIESARGDIPARGAGRPARLTRRRVDQIALTFELTGHGVSPADAARAAERFTDMDYATDGGFAWGADAPTPEPLPGHLFREGRTLLVLPRDGEARVINWKPGDDLGALFGGAASAVVVDVGDVLRRVDVRLTEMNNDR